jgi:predicted dehydrogenase
MPKQVRYAVIGAGAIAQRRHLPEAHANPQSTVVAVADPVADRVGAIAKQYDAEPFTDYKKMLKSVDADAVVVAGPNKLHAPMSIAALNAGFHVLVEKPMAINRPEAKKMIAAAEKAKKYLMIGLNQRLMPTHVKAKEILDSGKLGKVLTFRTAFQHGGPDAWSVDGAKSWFFDPEAAFMGATGDLGVHKADLMRYLLGEEFESVGGFITTLDKKSKGKFIGLDDNAIINMRTQSGVCGVMTVSWTNYGVESNDTVLRCTNGSLTIDGAEEYGVQVHYKDGSVEKHMVGEVATNTKQVASGIIDSFTECIQKNKKPSIDGYEGYQCLNIILTAMEAAKAGAFKKIKH